MIIDTLDNLGKYVGLNPLFADVVEFMKSHDLNTLEPGKYPIKDKDLFLNLSLPFTLCGWVMALISVLAISRNTSW